jgi:trans-aconitate 2-methyltransferase
VPDVWDPNQYERFRRERAQPFYDLAALVESRPSMRVVDLGCGTGDTTLELHRKLVASETVGLDNSAAMLAKAPRADGLRFELGEIEQFAPAQKFDLVFSNAALHWVADHPALLRRLRSAIAPGGQLAVQMPANDAHASHAAAHELARSPEFRPLLGGFERRPPLLDASDYAALLHKLGFARQLVRVQVYGHLLESGASVIEWVKGTLLTDYQKRLAPEAWDRFLARYRETLLPRLADERPFLYTYPRIFLWGALAA